MPSQIQGYAKTVLEVSSNMQLTFVMFIYLQELVKRGALVSQCNKYGETPLDKCKPYLAEILRGDKTKLYVKHLSVPAV